jgi:hypothetical protein
MKFLAYLVLLSAIVISACGAYFSIVGLKLLFVGGGLSIVVMGTALEVGKLITATFLKQKWEEIGLLMKTYMVLATLALMGITSIGIYGYLSAGYTATSITVQGYEHQIESNNTKISEIEKEISSLKQSTYNEAEIKGVEENRKKVIEQRTQLVDQKNKQIENIRKSANTNQDTSVDIAAAKQALELAKSSTDNDISRELEQIKLFNSRLEILDKEVQKWMEEGTGGLFKKNGLDKARTVKEGQSKERGDIDAQIKASQDRISKLREQYASQVKEYNDRVAAIENRSKSQRTGIDNSIKSLEKEISDITASIAAYNTEIDEKVSSLNGKKNELSEQGKKKIADQLTDIQNIRKQNTELQEKIVHTDVGTFKFIANSLGIPLDKAVNYFIWTIMAVFDPLAICLILAFNVLIAQKKKEDTVVGISSVKNEVPIVPTVTPTVTPTATSIEPTKVPEKMESLPILTPTPTLSVEQVSPSLSTPPLEEPIESVSIKPIVEEVQLPTPTIEAVEVTETVPSTPEPTIIKNNTVEQAEAQVVHISAPPPPPFAPHGISSGKVSPR